MRFLMLIHESQDANPGAPSEVLLQAVEVYRTESTTGHIVDDGGLMPPADAVSVRSERGQVTVTDGPFSEAKEVIGGFFVVESGSPEQMAQWAKGFLDLHAEHWPQAEFTAEIRQIAGM